MSNSSFNEANQSRLDMQNKRNHASLKRRPWESDCVSEQDTDPLAGFANIMDVMLVFALGLMVALLSQSQSLQQSFNINDAQLNGMEISKGKELMDVPEAVKDKMQSKGSGMESLGTVYRDPETGKLILVGQ